jgi:stress response protein SCP2
LKAQQDEVYLSDDDDDGGGGGDDNTSTPKTLDAAINRLVLCKF